MFILNSIFKEKEDYSLYFSKIDENLNIKNNAMNQNNKEERRKIAFGLSIISKMRKFTRNFNKKNLNEEICEIKKFWCEEFEFN